MQRWKIIHMRNFRRCSIESVQDVFDLKVGRNSTKYLIIGIICVFNYLFIDIIKCNYLDAYLMVFYNIFRSYFLRIEWNINFWFWFSLDLSSPLWNFFVQFFSILATSYSRTQKWEKLQTNYRVVIIDLILIGIENWIIYTKYQCFIRNKYPDTLDRDCKSVRVCSGKFYVLWKICTRWLTDS